MGKRFQLRPQRHVVEWGIDMDPLLVSLCKESSLEKQVQLFEELLQKRGTDNWVLLQVAANVSALRAKVIMNHLGVISDDTEYTRALVLCQNDSEKQHVMNLRAHGRHPGVRRVVCAA